MSARDVLHWIEGKIVYSVGFGVVLMLAIGAVLFYFSEARTPRVRVVSIAYGAGAPVRKRFLEQITLHGKEVNLDVRLIATESTDQTLSLIDRHEADLGLIAGVVEDRGSRRVLEVTPLYMEPLQFLVKEELYESVSKDFGQLRGKSIDLDNPNSATNLMASELLRFMGLTNQAGQPQYQPVYIPQLKLAENTAGISLPDAIFQIGGVPSESIRNLIVNYHYRLVQLPFGTPFNLDKFRDAENPNSLAHSTLRLDKRSIEEAVIPAYVYSVLPPVPPVDTRTIATRLTMIGSDRLDSHVVHQILELVLSPQVGSFAKPPLTDDLLNSTFQFERHPGTDQYLKSLKPVDVEGAFTAYSRLGEIWGLVITVYIGAASGLKSWRNRRVAQRGAVADFLKQVLEVETEAGPSCSDAERISLDQRLSDIKKASIQLHLDGRLEDPEELPSLLVSLADTRTRIWRRAS